MSSASAAAAAKARTPALSRGPPGRVRRPGTAASAHRRDRRLDRHGLRRRQRRPERSPPAEVRDARLAPRCCGRSWWVSRPSPSGRSPRRRGARPGCQEALGPPREVRGHGGGVHRDRGDRLHPRDRREFGVRRVVEEPERPDPRHARRCRTARRRGTRRGRDRGRLHRPRSDARVREAHVDPRRHGGARHPGLRHGRLRGQGHRRGGGGHPLHRRGGHP